MKKKIKIPLGTSLQLQQRKEHFKRVLPFLRKEYRTISEKECKSEDVFKELFPDEVIDLTKLKAVYVFQNLV